MKNFLLFCVFSFLLNKIAFSIHKNNEFLQMDYDFGLNNQNDESLRDLSEKDHEDTLKIINNKSIIC